MKLVQYYNYTNLALFKTKAQFNQSVSAYKQYITVMSLRHDIRYKLYRVFNYLASQARPNLGVLSKDNKQISVDLEISTRTLLKYYERLVDLGMVELINLKDTTTYIFIINPITLNKAADFTIKTL
ncbi:hypothetical protein CEQ21_14220 [Niallia circulans]|uniref:Uncharacterized protein n=1 Tax=Niallia circulans TaxID=1397 RepID=A0A553SI75_NIACI|nr:hypothetical protein [Niallia circulans]TRZ36672.1 hypothetical protein CEQ21_14220 [Niallia circulans]